MKKQLLFFILLFFSTLSFAQSSLDSLRMVLPVGHNFVVREAFFSPDSKYILTLSMDQSAILWELNSGKKLYTLNFSDMFFRAEFSNDGKYILTESEGEISVYNTKNGILITRYKYGENKGLLCGNALSVVVNSENKLNVINTLTGEVIYNLEGRSNELEIAKLSLESKNLITISTRNNSSATMWNIEGKVPNRILNGHRSNITCVQFSPSGNYVITGSTDGMVIIWEVKTGKELRRIKGHEDQIDYIEFNIDGLTFITVSDDKSACLWDFSSGNLIRKYNDHSIMGKTACFSPDGAKLLTSFRDFTSKIWDVKSGELLADLIGHNHHISSSEFSKDGKYIVTASMDQSAIIWDATTGRKVFDFSGNSSWVNSNKLSSDGKYVVSASFDQKDLKDNIVHFWELESGKVINDFSGHKDEVHYAEISPSGEYLLSVSSDSTTKLWNVKTAKLELSISSEAGVNHATFSPDGLFFITSSDDELAKIYETKTHKCVNILSGHNSPVNYACFSQDGAYVITCTGDITFEKNKENRVKLWEVKTGKEIFKSRKYIFPVTSAEFSIDDKFVLLTCYDKIEIFNFNQLKLNRKNRLNEISGEYTSSEFLSNSEYIIASGYMKDFSLINIFNSKVKMNYDGHGNWVLNTESSSDDKIVISTGDDYKTIVWDLVNGRPIYHRILLENKNHIITLPNSPYYMCSKDASKMLHYVTPSLKVIGFEQLDPVYNRPDIVLDSIGKYFGGADAELVANYRESWEKRIDCLGLDKDKLGKGDIAVPDAEIVEADKIAYENKEGKLVINVKANDPKYTLRRFNVYVNEVPLYGSAGISIAHLNTKSWTTTDTIPLSVGENKIQVSVMNELGLENFKYPTYVNYTPEKNNEIFAKTHYIGIGVNEFKEAGHNLNYCVKDVRDLAKAFSAENTQIDTLLFTDEQVTRENILALKDYLKKTSVNDKVIISCSSHGLLDDSLNFYLAMYDVDFKNPKARGLKYEELEGLLDGIPARQKLLLLDACNSGENDKTELLKKELDRNKTTMDSDQVLASRGVIIKLEEENKSNFKKMNELFVNVRNNTGSVIISAAGGQESALEAIQVDGKTIENGAFTYSILECLKQNEGKELKVNTLKQYAEKRVEEITNGKQKPTSRQETMEVDWRVR
jgi:WD40 repeat protein